MTQNKSFWNVLTGIVIGAMLVGCCNTPGTTSKRFLDSNKNTENLLHSTVSVVNPWTGMPGCTGFFVSEDLLLTARHCVLLEDETTSDIKEMQGWVYAQDIYLVTYEMYSTALPDDMWPLEAKVIYMEPHVDEWMTNDVVVLKLNDDQPKSKHWLPIAAESPALGAKVYSAGLPGNTPWAMAEGMISQYFYTERDELPFAIKFLYVEISVDFGNSGGPLVNDNGEVVGIAHKKDRTSNFGVFIPHDELRRFLYGFMDLDPKPEPAIKHSLKHGF